MLPHSNNVHAEFYIIILIIIITTLQSDAYALIHVHAITTAGYTIGILLPADRQIIQQVTTLQR